MIDFECFVNWAKLKFGDLNVLVQGDEVRLNSIFTDDNKHKLYCNPKGGKHNVPDGVYHCWKTNTTGTLVSLVMKVDKCDHIDAKDKLGSDTLNLADLEAKFRDMFVTKNKVKKDKILIDLPTGTYNLKDLPKTSRYRIALEKFLVNRKMPADYFMVCTDGEFKNRIIIPWRDQIGSIIYFNSRAIDPLDKLRYRGPNKDIGVGKGDLVFFADWPQPGSRIYLTEGEIDAMSLYLAGFNGCATGGKNVTEKQIELLKPYRITLSFDNDTPGKGASDAVGEELVRQGFPYVNVIRPPKDIKDWNQFLKLHTTDAIKDYITASEKAFDLDQILLQRI